MKLFLRRIFLLTVVSAALALGTFGPDLPEPEPELAHELNRESGLNERLAALQQTLPQVPEPKPFQSR